MKEQYNVAIAAQSDFVEYMISQMDSFGLPCSVAQAEDLYVFYAHLIETNKYLNLTGITDMREVVVKHMVDSLSCYDPQVFIPGSAVIDVGTGAGFPGVPLAIYDRSLKVTLFDSLKKRLTFLESVIDALNLDNCTVLHGRAEDLGRQAAYRESFDIATSRAVARLPVLLEWTLPYVREGGYAVALKGAAYGEEIDASGNALAVLGGTLTESRLVALPVLNDRRAVLYIKKTKKTPPQYPRKPKDIKARPL